MRARKRIIRLQTPKLRNLRGPQPPRHHPLPHIRQPRRRVDQAPVLALRVMPPAPEHLARCAGARPHDAVDRQGVDGLGPHGDLAAEDVLGRLLREAGRRVVGVDEGPGLCGAAPVVEGVERLEGGAVGYV